MAGAVPVFSVCVSRTWRARIHGYEKWACYPGLCRPNFVRRVSVLAFFFFSCVFVFLWILHQRCRLQPWQSPRTNSLRLVDISQLSSVSSLCLPKKSVWRFVPYLSCENSNSRRALEAVVSGRADGSAGPTVGSFCAALVKTGGSAVLMWAFFRGLQQMSASDAADSAVAELPEGPEEGGLL